MKKKETQREREREMKRAIVTTTTTSSRNTKKNKKKRRKPLRMLHGAREKKFMQAWLNKSLNVSSRCISRRVRDFYVDVSTLI